MLLLAARSVSESTASDEARSQLYRQLAAQQTEFAALPSSLGARRALFESPFQRLHRLRTEVAEFQADLEQMSQPTVYGASADEVAIDSSAAQATSSVRQSTVGSSMLNDACAAVADQLRALERELGQAALDSRMQPMAGLLTSGADSSGVQPSSASASSASVDHVLAHLARWRRGGAAEGAADAAEKSEDAKPAAVIDRPQQVCFLSNFLLGPVHKSVKLTLPLSLSFLSCPLRPFRSRMSSISTSHQQQQQRPAAAAAPHTHRRV
jgi:hypothetical protein